LVIANPREKNDGSSLPTPLTVIPLVAVSASSSVNRFDDGDGVRRVLERRHGLADLATIALADHHDLVGLLRLVRSNGARFFAVRRKRRSGQRCTRQQNTRKTHTEPPLSGVLYVNRFCESLSI